MELMLARYLIRIFILFKLLFTNRAFLRAFLLEVLLGDFDNRKVVKNLFRRRRRPIRTNSYIISSFI